MAGYVALPTSDHEYPGFKSEFCSCFMSHCTEPFYYYPLIVMTYRIQPITALCAWCLAKILGNLVVKYVPTYTKGTLKKAKWVPTAYAFIKNTGCNLKTRESLFCALIGVCAVIRSNTVTNVDRDVNTNSSLKTSRYASKSDMWILLKDKVKSI